jgi:hypothetical protein
MLPDAFERRALFNQQFPRTIAGPDFSASVDVGASMIRHALKLLDELIESLDRGIIPAACDQLGELAAKESTPEWGGAIPAEIRRCGLMERVGLLALF